MHATVVMEKTGGKFSYRQIFDYINSGFYPEGLEKQDKLSLRKRAKYFIIEEAQLYYVGGKTITIKRV